MFGKAVDVKITVGSTSIRPKRGKSYEGESQSSKSSTYYGVL